MKDMGEASYMLGVKIIRNCSRKLLGLSQHTYIKRVLEQFRMHHSKPIDTLMEKNHILSLNQCPKMDKEKEQMSNVPYASVVGSLIYIMMCTCPDISSLLAW